MSLRLYTFVIVLSLALITLVIMPSEASVAVDIVAVVVARPLVLDLQGEPIVASEVGQQVIIQTMFSTYESERQPFVGYFELRDANGITQFVAWQSGILESRSNATIGFSWSPQEPSNYEVRAFAIAGFERPFVLSPISESEINVRTA